MAVLLVPAAAAAQSSEFRKTMPLEEEPGQTVVRKTRPTAIVPVVPPKASVEAPFPMEAKSVSVPAPAEDWPSAGQSKTATVTRATVTGSGARTRFSMLLTARVPYRISKMANPYRIIIDMPDVDFRLPANAGQTGAGLVHAYRYGQFAPGKARIVIDTTQPVRVHKQAINTQEGESGVEIALDFTPIDEAAFMADVAPPVAFRDHHGQDFEDAGTKRRFGRGSKPVIVIDPGHGGLDPGAPGAGFREKDVVLAVAHQVREALEATHRYEVFMTRTTDVFITLGGRVAFSRRMGANLFVSIHANSVPSASENAAIVRGAQVFTLSEGASNREAQRLAEKENSADLMAGAETVPEQVSAVDRILAELKMREASEFSADFRGRLLTRLKHAIVLAREPAPSAALQVLRQTECPSVLIELGYVTNAKDAQLLTSPEWQRQAGQSIAAAINDFFASRGRRP
jgi:N-acetylmuramoyl-L-alanine amidase